MACRIKEVVKRFDAIAEERRKFHLAENSASGRVMVHTAERETFSFVIKSEIVGRNEDKRLVIEFLTKEDNDEDLSILPIVGLGGVGKTTLAQFVYNDDAIKQHFELRMWVCVAEDFDVKVISKKILDRSMGKECHSSDLEEIQIHLRESLRARRYLLVLDDVWNEDAFKFEKLKLLLRGHEKGCKIMVTTRSEEVARLMGTVARPYKLEVLSDDDCWTLFKQRAFGPGREEENSNIVNIGKEIVRKCGGLPLAAKSLGSLMATKRGEAEWLDIQNSEIWKIGEADGGILPALKISYDHLPPPLKQCFAYCSVFPKDYEFERSQLIQLWIAEGFVQPLSNAEEKIGLQYFSSLTKRSFFQHEEEDYYTATVTSKMHDLVHDLACFVSTDKCCMMDANTERHIPQGYRYYSIISGSGLSVETLKSDSQLKKLRSFFIFDYKDFNINDIQEFVQFVVRKLTRLRALHFGGLRIENIPHAIGKLKHLRFLDLSNTNIRTLPDSIISLYNLRALYLRWCQNLVELPEQMGNMGNLRHLDLWGCWYVRMPLHLGRLMNLKTLTVYCVGGQAGGRTISELQNLNLLRGRLCLTHLEKVKDSAEAKTANLGVKTDLVFLEFRWDVGSSLSLTSTHYEEVLEELQPPPYTRKLTIHGYMGSRLPSWIVNLSHLASLDLDRHWTCEILPPFGQLPSLQYLRLQNLTSVRRIGREFYGVEGTFPKLISLEIWEFFSLEEWVAMPGMNMYPCLEYLEIRGCPKLIVTPFLPSSIVRLRIQMSNAALLSADGCLQHLPLLRYLMIKKCEGCYSATAPTGWDGLQHLPSLREMLIEDTSDLSHLREVILQSHFPSFETLNFRFMRSLDLWLDRSMQPPIFRILQHLFIWDCHSLTSLPEWVGNLLSLKSLKIEGCPDIESLPVELQNLKELQQLTIIRCPILEERCMRGGADWHKIAHIPRISIR